MENDHICLKVLENKVLLVFVGRVNIAGADEWSATSLSRSAPQKGGAVGSFGTHGLYIKYKRIKRSQVI